ncbi:endoplasmic reticulum Oxidoreductin 1-domain-containing protein [Dipodascopsis uninucleata]
MRSLSGLSMGIVTALAVLIGLIARVQASFEIGDDIGEASFEISIIDKVNEEKLRPLLHDIVTTSDFFKYYRLDLYGRPCPFWSDEGMCGNIACAVDTIDNEDHLPEIWRSEYLGLLSDGSLVDSDDDLDTAFGDDTEASCVKDSDEMQMIPRTGSRDYCVPEDETGEGPGVYVNLVDNPERYTGYSGPHANKVWQAIYTENCFNDDNVQSMIQSPFGQALIAGDKHVIQEVGGERGRQAMITQNMCLEKRVFYKLISGMHASISTHLSYEYLDTETGEWGPDLNVFMEKVGDFPERISNIYFNYALVSKAVGKLRSYLEDFTFCSNAQGYDAETRRKMLRIAIEADRSVPDLVDVSSMFKQEPKLKEEFRQRFVNVSRIMDCTGCDKCRLWGKLQVTGYATALKILFELPDSSTTGDFISLRRMEMVALINTYDRLSKSIEAINMFRQMQVARDNTESAVESALKDSASQTASFNESFWSGEWDPEWRNVWEAIKFILKSYYDFPKNIWKIFLYHMNNAWTKFIGRESFVYRQRYEQLRIQTVKDEL